MPGLDLLFTYALAVQRMRDLQRQLAHNYDGAVHEECEAAKREVDELTTLHLLPTMEGLDFLPLITEGK